MSSVKSLRCHQRPLIRIGTPKSYALKQIRYQINIISYCVRTLASITVDFQYIYTEALKRIGLLKGILIKFRKASIQDYFNILSGSSWRPISYVGRVSAYPHYPVIFSEPPTTCQSTCFIADDSSSSQVLCNCSGEYLVSKRKDHTLSVLCRQLSTPASRWLYRKVFRRETPHPYGGRAG